MSRSAPASANTAIPLAFRVPNPPATFVGREPELRAVRAALKRGSVVVLCGLGGLGKTSLALATVKKLLPTRLRAAVMVRMTPQPMQQALVELLRALGSLAARKADWSSIGREEELLALALDLAEEHSAVVVLDDLHHGGLEILLAAARFARRSLWIATSRVEPEEPELAGQIVRLGPLPDGKLASLARLIAPRSSSASVRDAVRAASGSPWRLRSTMLGEPSRDSPLEGLGDTHRAVLEALGVSERPLAEDALARIVQVDVANVVEQLARRGLVEVALGGVRLHDAARPWVAERLDASRKASVGRALAASLDESEGVEALRILLSGGDEEGARALCDRRAGAMLRAGYAPTVWKLLAPLADARWYTWKIRVAMQLANVDVVATLPPAPPDAAWERVLWIRALLVRGELAEAEAAAEALERAASGGPVEPAVSFWAGLLRAMAIHHRDHAERALAPLRALTPPDATAAALRDVLLAFWVAECGDPDGALDVLERAPDADPAEGESAPVLVLGAPVAFFVRYYRMAALMECGRLDEAHAAMGAGARDDLGEELTASRVAGNALANLAIARGHLAEARERLGRLSRSAGPVTVADVTALLSLELRIASGELAGAERALEQLASDAEIRMPLVHAWCVETRERLAVLAGRAPEGTIDLAALPLGPGTRRIIELRRAIREARWGRAPSTNEAGRDAAFTSEVGRDARSAREAGRDARSAREAGRDARSAREAGRDASRGAPRDVEGAILHAMLESVTAIAARRDGEPAARRALELAVAHGWAIRELESRELVIESLLARAREAAVEIASLASRAAEIGSRRFALSAELLAQVASATPEAPRLESIADAMDASPVAARRARALLDAADVPLDLVDVAVVDTARARAGVRTVGPAASWRRGWGVDVARKLLWREDGSTESLARHALYLRILSSLAARGGAASIEDLARDVWNVRNFRPLSDGNRIRVTMHRIRALLGAERIVLRDSGYALGGPPFRLVSPPPS